MEELIMNRIQEITEQYSELPQLEKYDLTLEAIGENGDVKVTLKKKGITFERLIKHSESLEWISDTFFYPDTFSHHSKDISLNRLKMAYFDIYGRLIVERDNTVEMFKVQDKHRERVMGILKEKMGNKFKS
jgi:hypothetical protein